jgi:RimJ/RimL family protein N-acetyltransferase
MRHRLLDDLEEARETWSELQTVAGCADKWPGDDHTYWEMVSIGVTIGLCSAVYRPEKGYAYLSYAVFDPACRGMGYQRQSIRYRLRWAKRQGAAYAVTYTLTNNYPSIYNLLKCGFRFSDKPTGWRGIAYPVHYFEKQL